MDSVAEASEHEITVLDTTVRVKAPSMRQLDVIRNRVFTETYAMETKDQLTLAGVTDGSTIIDIGANIGYTSILYSLLFPSSKIIAIEPSELNFEFLEYNTDEFSNITIINSGCHHEQSVAELNMPSETEYPRVSAMPDNTGLFTIHSDSEGGTEVQLRPLDDIVAEQNPAEIDYIKIDVEGNELNTIKGGKQTLEQHNPALEVEINPQILDVAGRDHDEIIQYMNSLGYEMYLYSDNELARWEMTNQRGLTQLLGKLPNRIQSVFEIVPFVDISDENTVRDVVFLHDF